MTTAVARPIPITVPWRRVPVVVLGVLVLTSIAYPLTAGGARTAVTWAIVLLGAALSIAHAALSRGLRTAVAVLFLVAAAAIGIESVGLATGVPYGSYRYSGSLGPTLLGVPFLVPLAWLMMAWPSFLLGDLLTRRIRRHWRTAGRIVTAAVVFAGWDLVLDPQLVQAGYWTWAHPTPGLPGIPTVPLTNLGGWLLAGLLLMTMLDLVVGRTSVTDAPRLDGAAPLLALGWMTVGGSLAQAGWLGLPGPAAWGAGLAVPVVAVLVRRIRSGAPP